MRESYRRQTREAPLGVRLLRQNLPLLAFFLFVVAGMLSVYWRFNPESNPQALLASSAEGAKAAVFEVDSLVNVILKPVPALPVTQRLAQSPGPVLVGLIAGHRGFDSGTVCTDGLTEVQITEAITERVAGLLGADGVDTETLDEFDARLDGYSATALVSIHVDSCDYINELATGFKISGSHATDSSDLSICVEGAYQRATGLAYHPNSITPHMSDYHVFREIAPGTPAIIIEIGFLNLDREILTSGADRVVDGLVEGVQCYLEQLP